ncbi:MAG: hypothetical protein IPF79_04525 [Ignavibacteria bacterium]|nr:hypothetical protein [Ignavibacteria bacterium]
MAAVVIQEISCSRNGGVVAVAWNNTNEDSADCVVFRYPSLELILEHAIGDTQPSYRPFYWGLYPITVSPKGTYLVCLSIDPNGVSLFDLTSSDDPTTIFAGGYLPVCFDTAESIVATFTGSADPFNRFAAQINVIELTNPDSLARVIKVIDVGLSRSSASFGISSDGTEVFYGGGGSEFKGNRTGPRCGTWDVATGVRLGK